MSWCAYIRKGRVYVPTSAETADGLLIEIEPIEVADIDDVDAIGRAVSAAICRGRIVVPTPRSDTYKHSPILAMANVKTWRSFYKGTHQLCFMRRETGFEIVRLKPYERGFQTDETTRVRLPRDLSLTEVVDRIVDEIQREGFVK